MLNPVRTTPPTLSPVSLEEVRLHLRIDHTDEDPTLQLYIDAATGYFETILDRALVSQSWAAFYPAFADPLVLPQGLQPVQSVTALNYYDSAEAAQLLDPALYRLVPNAAGGAVIERTTDAAWPATAMRDDAVTVALVTGEEVLAVPPAIRQAMLLLVGHWYANRETVGPGTVGELPYAVTALLINHARIAFG